MITETFISFWIGVAAGIVANYIYDRLLSRDKR